MEKSGKERKDLVSENAIHVETIKKERRHQRLFTEFSLNPRTKLDFIREFHKAREEPTKKYSMPQTESQEVGWVSASLTIVDRSDRRFNFNRLSTDVTIHKELALRKGAQ